MILYDFKKISLIEKKLIEELDYLAIIMMENAANAITEFFLKIIEERSIDAKPKWLNEMINFKFNKAYNAFLINNEITFLVGSGNNGGDALAIARKISLRKEYIINILFFGEGKTELRKYQEKLIKNLNMQNINFYQIDDNYIFNYFNFKNDLNKKILNVEIYKRILSSPFLIDGITGIGLKYPIDEKLQRKIEFLEEFAGEDSFKISIDVPTGLTCFSNKVFKTDLTLMLQWAKSEFFSFENRKFCPSYLVVSCDMPDILQKEGNEIELVRKDSIKNLLKEREFYSNKGNFGKVFVISNSISTLGAPIIASKAAIKSGAGYVYLLIKEELENQVKTSIPYIITYPYDDSVKENLEKVLVDIENKFLKNILDYKISFVIGSGFGNKFDLFYCFLEKIIDKKINIVIDGDGLNFISQDLLKFNELTRKRVAKIILTPHKKEFEKIYSSYESIKEKMKLKEENISINDIDNKSMISYLNKGKMFFESGLLDGILLKDYISYFICKEGIFCNEGCFSGFSKAGTGDFIAGVFAVLLSNYQIDEAARILLCLQDQIALNLYNKKIANESIITEDLIEQLPFSISLLNQEDE